MSLDRIEEAGALYIGGIFSLKAHNALEKANITHVLTIVSHTIEPEIVKNYKHLAFVLDDVDYEDIVQHFPASNAFIRKGLATGGGVFVHCMMGKSRSATLICAYLMNQDPSITPAKALKIVQRHRPIVEPNEGFMEQLELYYKMGSPDEIETQPIYQRWLFERTVKESVDLGQAPEKIRFEDEATPSSQENPDVKITCRKCRRALASSIYLIPHEPKQDSATSHALRASNPIASLDQATTSLVQPQNCAHLFLDPLSWMKEELEQGKLEGRLECPKCRSNVGKYAWQGMRCTCNAWIVPGISLARSRVDEIKNISATRGTNGKI